MTTILIEVIFKGSFSTLDFSFLQKLLADAREIRFDSPETNLTKTFGEVISVIKSNTYIDLVVNTDRLNIDGRIIPKVFTNWGRNNDEVEVLFFFDLNDLNEATTKMNIDYLKKWVVEIQRKYNFQYFICQMDNADNTEYNFDSNGTGKLYDELNC